VAPPGMRGPTVVAVCSRLARGLTRGFDPTRGCASTASSFAQSAWANWFRTVSLSPQKKVFLDWSLPLLLGEPSNDPAENFEWKRWSGFLKTTSDLDRSKCASICSADRLMQYTNTAAQHPRHSRAMPAPQSTKTRGPTPSSLSAAAASTPAVVVDVA